MSEAPIPPAYENTRQAPDVGGMPAGQEALVAPAMGDPQAHVFARRTAIIIRERDVHIPSWYRPHAEPEKIVVTQGGQPLLSLGKPFTVAHIAPERRWAVDPRGELLPQHVFEEQLMAVRNEWFQVAYEQPQAYKGDLSKWHVPMVDKYVSLEVDPTNPSRLKPIHYEPHATDGAVSDVLYDPETDEMIDGEARLERLRAAYADPSLRKHLKDHELAAIAAAGPAPTEPANLNELASALAHANADLAAGRITEDQHKARVAALVGTELPPLPQEPKDKKAPRKPQERPSTIKMPCGEMVLGIQKKAHATSCDHPGCKEFA